MGGEEWDHCAGWHGVGQVVAGGQSGDVEIWEDVRTGRFVHRERLAAGDDTDGFDGVTPWHLGRSGIAYVLGDVDARLNAQNESYRAARGFWFADRHDAALAWDGQRTEAGRHFDVVRIVPVGGRIFSLWIDQATHLIARSVEQQAEDLVVTDYQDYRRVGGVMLPFVTRVGDGVDPAFDDVQTLTQIDINPAVDDTRFSVPPRPPTNVTWPAGQTSVQVPFRLQSNKILVAVAVDGGAPRDAEFDSGGSLLIQPAVLAEQHLRSAGQFKAGGGGEGTTTSGQGVADTLSIGGAVWHHPSFHVLAFNDTHPEWMLIGLETLQRFVVRFDFDRMVMTLTRPENFDYHGAGAQLDFHFQDNQPEVSGAVDGVAGLFTIDTGDNGSLLLIAPFARRYGFIERLHAHIPYTGRAVSATYGLYARAGTVTLNGPDGRQAVQVARPVTRISEQHGGFDANRDVSANIGIGILKQFNITFDYSRQRIILERNHLYGLPDVFNRAGLRLQADGAAWKIVTVYPGSPASDAGLKIGDRVSGVNGSGPAALDEDRLAALFSGAVGSALHISLGDRRIVLTLRDLL